jgi:hypothetical protein
MGRSESTLLNLSEVVLRVSIQGKLANWDQRIILVGYDLGHIEDVELIVLTLFLGDELNIPSP